MSGLAWAIWLLAILMISPSVAAEFVGTLGNIKDGDSFSLCNDSGCVIDIRLCGIDAPEAREDGYHEGAVALKQT